MIMQNNKRVINIGQYTFIGYVNNEKLLSCIRYIYEDVNLVTLYTIKNGERTGISINFKY